MKKKLPLFLILSLVTLVSNAQNILEGLVINEDTKEPLEQVSIYFPQLEKGTVTNDQGEYTFNNLPAGQYKIVASYIGFQTYSANVQIQDKATTLNISLTPSAIEMQEVIVSTPFHKLQKENVMKVEQAQMAELRTNGAITLADGITSITGVESVSTGVGIGKPVIRGLSSNRVLVYTQGIRLENQQFGDEHGLGISDAGIESIEVIKGPASLLYGSDALGGVLYLNPEKYAIEGSSEGDLNLNYFTNTLGTSSNLGYKVSGEKFRFLGRFGYETHADYRTGDKERVTNSRFKAYDLKTGIGYYSGNFKTDLRYNYNQSELGIPEEIADQSTSRSLLTPYQNLQSHILSSSSDLFFEDSSVKLVLGYIFNDRKEFAEDNFDSPELHMELSTLSYNLQYQLPKGKALETIVGVQGMKQNNENFGEEVLIPDAITKDIGVLATSHIHFDSSDIQIGLRYDHRKIEGEENGSIGEEGYIAPLSRDFNSVNASLGLRSDLGNNLVGRLNIASGFRAPNLAELTSNGVHEGTNRYEIGNASLMNEKNIQLDLSLEYANEHIEIFLNGFHNTVNDYIFLEPTGNFVGADPTFEYRQQNSKLYGGEIGFHFHPHPLDWLHLESTFESVMGKLDEGGNLPLIPANSLTNTLRIEDTKKDQSGIQNGYAYLTVRIVFSQEEISIFETITPGYTLINVGLGGSIRVFGKQMPTRLSINNVLNTSYISHLSRLKVDGIPNIGRNLSFGIQYPI